MSARREAELAAAGRRYIAAGWRVFVLPTSKVPPPNCERCRAEHLAPEQMEACRCLCCHGFYAATGDPARLLEMIRRFPRGLLAVRTGAASRIVVTDIDSGRGGVATMRRLVAEGKLPRTAAQRSGGDGYHFVYGHPGIRIQSGANKAGPGIDVKADGGYFVVAPSVHPRTGKPYRWLTPFTEPLTPLPDHWVQLLGGQPGTTARTETAGRVHPPAPARPASIRSGSRYACAALADEARQVAAAAEGSRNDRLNIAAYSLARFIAQGHLTEADITDTLLAAASACGLEADTGQAACLRTIASGIRGALVTQKAAG